MIVVVGLALSLLALGAMAQYGEWTAPVNLGPVVNSSYMETCVAVSKDGLSMYYTTYRPGGVGGWDLFVSKRLSVNDPWGPPLLLPNVNSTVQESCPALSPDEHRLYFASGRPGGCGGLDFYVSRRHDRREDFGENGWQAPTHLGCELNSPYTDGTPTLFEDEAGNVVMYFGSYRGGDHKTNDIYASRMRDDGTFEPATLSPN